MNLHTALDLSTTDLNVISFIGAGGKSTTMFRLADELVQRGQRVITTTTTRIAADQILAAPAFVSVDDGRLPLEELTAALDRYGHCLLIGRPSAERLNGDKKAGVEPKKIDALAVHASRLNLSAILVEADGSRMLPAKAPADHEPAAPVSTTLAVSLIGMDALGLPLRDPFLHRPETIRALLQLSPTGPARLSPNHVAHLLNHPLGGRRGVPDHARFVPLLNKADTPSRLAQARLIARTLCQIGQSSLIGAVGSVGEPIRERWGGTAIVVMAGGASRRLGEPKQLVEIDGEAMVLRAVRTARQSDATLVLVVTGSGSTAVRELLANHEGGHVPPDPTFQSENRSTRLKLIHNERWEEGQASTIHAALKALPAEIQSAIFMPVDQPRLPATLLRQMQRTWRQGASLVACEVDGHKRGSPALFGRQFWPELMALLGDTGGRGILQRHDQHVTTIPVNDGWLDDIDAAEDLSRLLAQASIGDG